MRCAKTAFFGEVAGPRWSDDLQQIGGKLNQMAGAQEALVAALKQVSLDIAHDLKTPIQRVSVHLDDLARVTQDGTDQAALITKAQDELDGIASVFQSLLQLAQVEAGSPKARFTTVDLTALCQTMVEVFEPTATEQGQVLHCNLVEGKIEITGDRALLGQMVSNLIENAMRHTPQGTNITVGLDRHNGRTRLMVCDTGPGIPAEAREKVLQRLYRLDRSRHTPGNGLGLSLVDAVAKLHGAELELRDNAPGLCAVLYF